jgi:hypothetical protein
MKQEEGWQGQPGHTGNARRSWNSLTRSNSFKATRHGCLHTCGFSAACFKPLPSGWAKGANGSRGTGAMGSAAGSAAGAGWSGIGCTTAGTAAGARLAGVAPSSGASSSCQSKQACNQSLTKWRLL